VRDFLVNLEKGLAGVGGFSACLIYAELFFSFLIYRYFSALGQKLPWGFLT
jgi:hypothetical protein